MNAKLSLVALGCFVAIASMFTVECSSGANATMQEVSTADKFCAKMENCQLDSCIEVSTYGECLSYAKNLDAVLGDCVISAPDCPTAKNCFILVDDDDDDSSPLPSAAVLTGYLLFLGSLDYDMFSYVDPRTAPDPDVVHNTIGTHERALVEMTYVNGCDLAGGEMYYRLDDWPVADYQSIPASAPCSNSGSATRDGRGSRYFAYDLSTIAGSMSAGQHTLRCYYVDKNGGQTNTYVYNYTVADTAYSIGMTMPDFTENDENGDAISLGDYAGKAVLIDGFAQWCEWCQVEAGDLATQMAAFYGAGKPVAIIGLMNQTDSMSSTIPQSVLEDWTTTYGWAGAGWTIHCLDDGDRPDDNPSHPSVQEKCWWADAYPFNMVLDANHVIRIKWEGYGVGLAQDALQFVLDHPNPPTAGD